jgi:protein transport protein SEC31
METPVMIDLFEFTKILGWDINHFDHPFTPGPKSQRLQDITCVSWNRQVQHILASSSSNGCTVIWDLKSRREIIHLAAPNSRHSITSLAWHPDTVRFFIG